jgi:hypothetical protein
MSNMSVADILRIHGKWIQTKELVLLVAQKMRISERQAYRLIKKNKELIRIPLTNRNVIYGLAEFGKPHSHENKQFSYYNKDKQKPLFNDHEIVGLSSLLSSQSRYLRFQAAHQIWLKRGAKPEEKPDPENI